MRIYTNTKRAMRLWLLRRQRPCDAMVPLMSESLERSLNARERLALGLHLTVCAWCAAYLKQLKFMRRLLRLKASSLDSDRSIPPLSLAARERIVATLNRKSVR